MRVLLTGATGFVGRALAARLLASGCDVTALTRAPRNLPQGVRPCEGDLADGRGLTAGLFDGIECVFHCAGVIGNADAMREVHVDGTRRLLDLAPAARPVRWIQLSSVGAYGPPDRPGDERVVGEDSPEHPRGEYEITKTESDCLVRDASSAGAIRATILRPSAIAGAAMPNASLRGLIAAVAHGRFFFIGPRGSRAHYVHIDDVVSALWLCTGRQAEGQTFNLSSDTTWEALVERACARLGRRPPRLRVPAPIVRAASAAAALAGSPPVTAAQIDALVSRSAYPSAKIESSLGFRFARPMPDAIDDVMSAP